MTRAKRLLRAAGAGVAAVAYYVVVLGAIAAQFGEIATILFIAFTATAFLAYHTTP